MIRRIGRWSGALLIMGLLLGAASTVVPSSRALVGGLPVASPDVAPQTTALLNERGGFVCGSTLIAPTWLITASHCTNGVLAQARIGSLTKTEGGQVHQITEVLRLPDLADGSAVDAALIRIFPASPVPPAPIADMAESVPGRQLLLMGWGLTAPGGSASSRLLSLSTSVVPSDSCGRITYAEVCLANADYEWASPCFGDSGGPAYAITGNRLTLVGVTSRAGGPVACQGKATYTNVTLLRSVIEYTTGRLP